MKLIRHRRGRSQQISRLNTINHQNVTKYTSAQGKWRVKQGWAGTGCVCVSAGWPWSLDMAGTSGSTRRAWWWAALMPSVPENSGSPFSRMWVGLKFLPVVVRCMTALSGKAHFHPAQQEWQDSIVVPQSLWFSPLLKGFYWSKMTGNY